MPRIVSYPPLWLDKQFQKHFKKLSKTDQKTFRSKLKLLLGSLFHCTHPITDERLRRFRPSAYPGESVSGGQICEYRPTAQSRVITCYFPDTDEIYLLTATIKHDHKRIRRLLRTHRSAIDNWDSSDTAAVDYEDDPI